MIFVYIVLSVLFFAVLLFGRMVKMNTIYEALGQALLLLVLFLVGYVVGVKDRAFWRRTK